MKMTKEQRRRLDPFVGEFNQAAQIANEAKQQASNAQFRLLQAIRCTLQDDEATLEALGDISDDENDE